MNGVEERTEKRNDRRSRRTRRMLNDALVALMLEKRYDAITVQEIIDRANVGRSTFYAHYFDKEDLLQDGVAEMMGHLEVHVEQGGGTNRLIPSLELLRHLGENYDLYHALVRGRAIEPVFKMMKGHMSEQVETRLARLMPPGTTPDVPLPVVATHVVGAFITLFEWWLERGMPETPEEIDRYFLQLVRPSVLTATGVEI